MASVKDSRAEYWLSRNTRTSADGRGHNMLCAHQTEVTLGCFFQVYRDLGFGFLESNYTNAMAVELAFRGVGFQREVPTEVLYRGVSIGRFRLDLVVDDRVIVEIKATKTMVEARVLRDRQFNDRYTY